MQPPIDPSRARLVKVRVNASGERLVGFLFLPHGVARTSEALNSGLPFLVVYDDASAHGMFHAIEMGSITYVETLVEPGSTHVSQPIVGAFRRVRVSLRALDAILVGEVFVPEHVHLSDAINDARPFLNIRNAEVLDTVEHYSFLAVSKRHATFIEGLDAPETSGEVNSM